MVPKLHLKLVGYLVILAALPFTPNAARSRATARSRVAMTLASRTSTGLHVELQRMLRERQASEEKLRRELSLEEAYKMLREPAPAPRGGSSGPSREMHEALVHPGDERDALQEQDVHQALETVGKVLFAQTGSPSRQGVDIGEAQATLGRLIGKATQEYDQLHLECSISFKRQISLLEVRKDDRDYAASREADWRSQVMQAERDISISEDRIPRVQEELAKGLQDCNARRGLMRRELQDVFNDIDVMAGVLKATECSGASFAQLNGPIELVRCRHPCRRNVSFAMISHKDIQRRLSNLRSRKMRRMVEEGLLEAAAEVANGDASPSAKRLLLEWRDRRMARRQLRRWHNGTVIMPVDPCLGINPAGAVSRGPCNIRSNPKCFHVQNKFLSIQAQALDERYNLRDALKRLNAQCQHNKESLESELSELESKASDAQNRLAECTSGENQASREARMKGLEHERLQKSIRHTRSTCAFEFRGLEAKLCSLRKVRSELLVMKGEKQPFFQDCQVGDWEAQECSASCGGGQQVLRRSVILPAAGGGSPCPPLKQVQSCNELPCPVACVVEAWSGWTHCSTYCGGGIRERARIVRVQPRYNGAPCGSLTEAQPCNAKPCNSDCELELWSRWSPCSKACDGGLQVRRRALAEAAKGTGSCPSADGAKRLQRRTCNVQACSEDPEQPLLCASALDLVLLLDGSGRTGPEGWKESKAFAKKLLTQLQGKGSDVRVAVIAFGGPLSYRDLQRCTGTGQGFKSPKEVGDVCKVTVAQHFSDDLGKTAGAIESLAWPGGSTLTSVALQMARFELDLSRHSVQRVVLTITDGQPLSMRAASYASRNVRHMARLMFGAVGLNDRAVRHLARWGTAPARDNVLNIRSWPDLNSVGTVNKLIEDMCRNVTTS